MCISDRKSTTEASYTWSITHSRINVFYFVLKDVTLCIMNIISQSIRVMQSSARGDYWGLHWAAPDVLCTCMTCSSPEMLIITWDVWIHSQHRFVCMVPVLQEPNPNRFKRTLYDWVPPLGVCIVGKNLKKLLCWQLS